MNTGFLVWYDFKSIDSVGKKLKINLYFLWNEKASVCVNYLGRAPN